MWQLGLGLWLPDLLSYILKKTLGVTQVPSNTIQRYRDLNFEDKGQAYIIPPEQKCSNVFYRKHADMFGNLVYDHGDQI